MPDQNCLKAQELIALAVDAEAMAVAWDASAEDGVFVEKHLIDCDACRDYRHDLQTLTASLQDLEPVAPPAGLSDRIMAQIEPAALPVAASSRPFSIKRYAPLAAAVLLLALAVPYLMPSADEDPATIAQTPITQPVETTTTQDLHQAVEAVAADEPEPALSEPTLAAHPIKTAAENPPQPVRKITQPKTTMPPTQTAQAKPAPNAVASQESLAPVVKGEIAYSTLDEFGAAGDDEIYDDPMADLVGF